MIRVVKAELKSSAHRHYGGGRFFDHCLDIPGLLSYRRQTGPSFLR